MIIAALDTGMRQGEMLALRFARHRLGAPAHHAAWPTTKSGKTRVVPISTDAAARGAGVASSRCRR